MYLVNEHLTGAAAFIPSSRTLTVVSGPSVHRWRQRRLDRPCRVTLTGELRHQVHALLRRGERRIVLDVGQLTSIDAAGIGQLVRVYNVTRAANGRITLLNVRWRVRDVLERVGLFELFSAPIVGEGASQYRREIQKKPAVSFGNTCAQAASRPC